MSVEVTWSNLRLIKDVWGLVVTKGGTIEIVLTKWGGFGVNRGSGGFWWKKEWRHINCGVVWCQEVGDELKRW